MNVAAKILILSGALVLSIAKAQTNPSCDNRILVAATGDIMVHHQPYLDASRSPERFFLLWKNVAPYIQVADIAYGNLEAPVAMGIDANGRDHGDIGFVYDQRVYSGTRMIFNYHPQVLKDLYKTGFDVLSTANNHTMDRRSIGIDRTLEELIRGDWEYTGTRFSDGRGEWGVVTTVKGKSIYWLACTQDLNGNPDPKKQVLNCYSNQNEIENRVQYAIQNYDAVILTPHWGDEYSETPNARQKKWAMRMASLGVTIIVGNHPHVLQPLDKIWETWIAYSLGNFSAWQAGTARKTSAILYFDLRENSQGRLSVKEVKALPIYRIGQVMYPYYNTMSSEALQYVRRHMGSHRIVSGANFESSVLSCED